MLRLFIQTSAIESVINGAIGLGRQRIRQGLPTISAIEVPLFGVRGFSSQVLTNNKPLSRLLSSNSHKPHKIGTGTLTFTPRPRKGTELSESVEEFVRRCLKEAPQLTEYPMHVTDIAHVPESNPLTVEALISEGVKPALIVPHVTLTQGIPHDKKGEEREKALESAREEKWERLRCFVEDLGIRRVFFPRGNPRTVDPRHLRNPHYRPVDLELLWPDQNEFLQEVQRRYPELQMSFAVYPEGHVETQKEMRGRNALAFGKNMKDFKSKIQGLSLGNIHVALQHTYRTEFIEHAVRYLNDIGIKPSQVSITFYPLHLVANNMATTMAIAGGVQIPMQAEEVFARCRNEEEKNLEAPDAYIFTEDDIDLLETYSREYYSDLRKCAERNSIGSIMFYTNGQFAEVCQFMQDVKATNRNGNGGGHHHTTTTTDTTAGSNKHKTSESWVEQEEERYEGHGVSKFSKS